MRSRHYRWGSRGRAGSPPAKERRKRMAGLALFFVLGFSIISYRCVYLHLARDPKLVKRANTQYTTKLKEAPPRGNIYDANGEELAVSVSGYSLAARPGKIKERQKFLSNIAPLIGMKESEIDSRLDPSKKYVWLKKTIAPQEKEPLLSLVQSSHGSVELVKMAKRYYPNREVASQILGAVGQDNDGLGGLELFYDRTLHGGGERSEAFRDARGKTYVTEETLSVPEKDPNHLHLTIRKNIQYTTEKELTAACDAYHAYTCTAIVMNPQTGAILAMASYPNFNPNSYQDYALTAWRNLAVTDTFEPGSTFKTMMAAAAVESGLVQSRDKFFCENGALTVGRHVIHDHEKYGMMTLREILKVSSNIGIYKVGRKVGKKKFGEIVNLFGFGKKTGIDYPGEASGYMRPAASWQDIEFANISFGQGIRVTPLQLASGFATIANGGVRMKPYFVSEISDSQGNAIIQNKPHVVSRVLSQQTADKVIDMLTEVTREGGTATKAALPGYTVAGKTGTSQKFVKGAYSHTKFMSSFVGIVPAENPKLVILVTIDEPQGVVYGGLVAAPVFKKIAWESLRDLGIPSLTPSAPPSGSPLIREASLLPKTLSSSQDDLLPDFRGLSKRKVLALLDEVGLQGEMVGSGAAISQSPAPGSVIEKGKVCRVQFREE